MSKATSLKQFLANPRKFTEIDFSDQKIGAEGAIALSEVLKNHSNLNRLYLENNQIGDEGAIALSEALKNHSNLNVLSLNNNQIGDEGAIALSEALKNHSNLQYLWLHNNQIGDEGAAAILDGVLKSVSTFNKLYLQQNYISSNLVQLIKSQLSNIQYLGIDQQYPANQQPQPYKVAEQVTLVKLNEAQDKITESFSVIKEAIKSDNFPLNPKARQNTQKTMEKIGDMLTEFEKVNLYSVELVANRLAELTSEDKLTIDSINQLAEYVSQMSDRIEIIKAINEVFEVRLQELDTTIQANNLLSDVDKDQIVSKLEKFEQSVTQLPNPALINSMIEKVKELSESDEFNTGQFADMYNLIEQLQSEVRQMHDEVREIEDKMFCMDQGSVSALIIDYYIPAMKASPEQPKLYDKLGNLFRAQGDYEKAIKCYKVINNNFRIDKCFELWLEQAPENPEIMLQYGDHLQSIGEFDSAKKQYNGAASLSDGVTFKREALKKVKDLITNQQSVVANLTKVIELSHQLDQNAFYNFELVNDEFIQDLLGDM